MRKTIFSLLSFLSVTSLCFAQQAQAPVSKPGVSPVAVSKTAPVAIVSNTLIAKVDAITIGDAAKATQSELAVVTDDGKKLSFVVKSGTPVTGKEAKAIALSDLKKDDKVAVEYITKATGTKKALSIKLVE